MKRDMELIRKIILIIEDSENGYAPKLNVPDYTDEEIGYHAYLIVNGGLAVGVDDTQMRSKSPAAILIKLTWAGHEFADAARNESIWKNAMEIVKEKSGAITVGLLTQLLVDLLKKAIGLPQPH